MKNNKKMTLAMLLLSMNFMLVACTEQTSSSNNATSTNNQVEAPNKFLVSAANKIKATHAGMTTEQALCVVNSMTADGKIGLGEINQMNLTDLTLNTKTLAAAYQASLKTCQ